MISLPKYIHDIKDNKKIIVFDIDDTLITSDAKVYVMKNGKVIKELTSAEYNTYHLKRGESFNFSEFDDPNILDNAHFTKYWDTLKREYKKGTNIGIITARSDINMFYDFFLKHGINLDKKLMFGISGDSRFDGSVAKRKKQAIELLFSEGYRTFIFFDDNEDNLRLAKELENELGIKVHTVKV